MSDKKKIDEGCKPLERGYRPTPPPKTPTGDKVQDGYKPETSEAKPAPNPPPKKP
jgi:hypothetical protein